MANYSDIRGYRVKYLSSDPTLNTSTEGQVWYNSTSGTLKSLVQIKAWSAGGNANVPRQDGMGDGTPTAAVYFGGDNAPGPTGSQTATEEYSGYAWASGGNMSTGRAAGAGFGTQTAAVCAAGNGATGLQTVTEEYDGATWTAGGAFPTASRFLGASGVLTAGLAANANESGVTRTDSSDAYDGTSWAATNPTLNPAQGFNSLSGTQTASLITHRFTASTDDYVTTESWDGTSWTSVANSNNAVYGSGAFGTQDHQISFGGIDGVSAQNYTEEWDGTTWFNSPATLSTADYYAARAGKTGTGGLKFGGRIGGSPGPVATEEYISDIANYDPSSADAWSSGGNMNVSKEARFGFGTQTAAIAAGGTFPDTNATEEYNGASWTTLGGTMGTGRSGGGSAGTTAAGLAFAGSPLPPQSPGTSTESWDGTSWAAESALNTARPSGASGVGVQTAALCYGKSFPLSTATEEYNGTSWASVNPFNTGRGEMAMIGIQTAALGAGGNAASPPNYLATTEQYDGTSWTAVNSLNTARGFGSGPGAGTITAGIAAGGNTPGPTLTGATELWDGTNWSNTASMATARAGGKQIGTQGTNLVAGGYGPSYQNLTEEFNGGSPASPTGAAASTLTTS